MRSWLRLVLASAALSFATGAAAQQEGMRTAVPSAVLTSTMVSVVPRWRRVRLDTDVNPVSAIDLNTYGLSIHVNRETSPFAVALDLNYGEAEEMAAFRIADMIDRDAAFGDMSARLEVAPMDSALVFLMGAHYLEANSDNAILNVPDSAFSSQTRALLAELGVRLVGQPSATSDHVVFAEALIGLGVGENDVRAGANSSLGRAVDINEEGFAAGAELALGWSYYLADRASIGARINGQVFAVDPFDDGEPVFAWGPELNGSFTF